MEEGREGGKEGYLLSLVVVLLIQPHHQLDVPLQKVAGVVLGREGEVTFRRQLAAVVRARKGQELPLHYPV